MKANKQIAIGVLIAASLLASAAVFAQPGFGPGRPGMMGRTGRMGSPLLGQLELSGDQRAQIETIFAGGRDAIHPLAQQLREKRAALGEAARALPFDETLVRSLAQQAADLQAQLMVARAQIANQLQSLLTEDQRIKLSQLRAERLQRLKEWRQQRMFRPDQQQS